MALYKICTLENVFDKAQVRPCGAMDSALDFGSSGCGFESHQDRIASTAQRIAHRTSNPGVAGSNPAGGAFFFSPEKIITGLIKTLEWILTIWGISSIGRVRALQA